MLIKIPRDWEMPESAATREAVYLDRRSLLKGAAAAVALAGPLAARATSAAEAADPSATRYPLQRNLKFNLDRETTPEKANSQYNNFYEFGSQKEIWRDAQKLPLRPWMVKIDGMVQKPMEIGIDDLLAKVPLEERLYRHRCVEAWAMAIPWGGFELSHLIKMVEPTGSAKFVQFETFLNPQVASGQKQVWYPWPYREALTLDEAMNELTFMVTGAYGKPAAKQFGAPLRLAVPWKYGFKSGKSLARITFTDKRPATFWETLQGSEYGFWANVNPAFDHPRWSQKSERLLGEDRRVPTQIYNGYGEFVAHLYKDLPQERSLFM